MTTRQLLLQELANTPDELLNPGLKFLRLLKTHPNDDSNLLIQALELLENQPNYETWLELTRQKVAVGLEQIEQGNMFDGDLVIARLQKKVKQARRILSALHPNPLHWQLCQ